MLWQYTVSLKMQIHRTFMRRGIEWSHSIYKSPQNLAFTQNYCSQKLDECSLAHACKIFATARMLRFFLKVLYRKTEKPWRKIYTSVNMSGNMHRRSADVLLNLTQGNPKALTAVVWHHRQQCKSVCKLTTMSTGLLTDYLSQNFFFSIKRDLDSYKIYEVLAARHLYFVKCSLLARHIWSLLLLPKINALLASARKDHSMPLWDAKVSLHPKE